MRSPVHPLLLALCCVSVMHPGNAETVYRKVEADGTVTYSDQPMPESEAVELQTLPPGVDAPTTPVTPLPRPLIVPATAPAYEHVTITSPAADSAGWYNDGLVSVSVTTQPPLQADHTLVLYLDDREAATGGGPTFQLSNVLRGGHTLQAAVRVGAQELQRSAHVRFHVLRHGVNSPQRRKNASPPVNPGAGGG